jgi:hypothetical protein
MDRAPVSKPARCEFDSRQGLPSVFACLRRAVRKIAVRLWAGQAFSCARRSDRVAGELGDEEAAHRHRPTFDGCAACAPRCPPIYLPVGCPPHPRILSMSDSEVERTELVVSRGAIFNAVVFQLMDYFRPSIGEGVTLFEYEAQAIAGDVVQQLLNHREMPDTRNVPATPSRDSCRPGAA